MTDRQTSALKSSHLFNNWRTFHASKNEDAHQFGENKLQVIAGFNKQKCAIFSEEYFGVMQKLEIHILYGTSPHLRIVAIEKYQKTVLFKTCVSFWLLRKVLCLSNFVMCSVFIWGNIAVYAFCGQFKHLILWCFQSSLREKQSCWESHIIQCLECTPTLTE